LNNSGLLDLNGNDALIHHGDASSLRTQLRSGFLGASGTWSGTSGIKTSAGQADSRKIIAIGLRALDSGSFDGQSLSSGDVVLKETFFGDANLDGSVNSQDYSLIDFNVTNGGTATGGVNGDFNYDGVVNAADYSLIDTAYAFQSVAGSPGAVAPLAVALAATSSSAAVPEPASFGLLAVA